MKNFKLSPLRVAKNKPYKGDLLERDKLGTELLELVDSFTEGFVMAINGKWGSGKTTFVHMWQQQMKNNGYETIYYNAWENDYISDPLISIIAEFKKLTTLPGQKKLEKYTAAFAKISTAMVPSILALATKKITGLDLKDFKEIIKDGSEEAVKILNKSIDNYIEQQKTIKSLKRALKGYVDLYSPNKPIIFIIDELDRCKPDFAVKTLERIKHLLNIKKIVFVLAIDREQLGHSICGYYGSDLFDADDYLRRFIDIPIDLPTGNTKTVEKLVVKVLNQFGFDKTKLKSDNGIFEAFKNTVESLYKSRNMSIRQLEKWMIQTRLVVDHAFDLNIYPHTLSVIVYLRDFDAEFYNHLMKLDISDQQILDHLTDYFRHSSFSKEFLQGNGALVVIAEILRMRYFDNDDLYHKRIIDSEGNLLLDLNAGIDKNEFLDVLKFFEKRTIPVLSQIQELLL